MKPKPGQAKGAKVPQVRIRRAVVRDKGPILEICRKVWDGGDYVPEVWDDWLRDRSGLLLVATVKGSPVGVAHGYLQTPDVAWLEGVRVHEEYRGLGIAGKLNRALTSWAAARGARVARLCTGSSNVASLRHLRKVGLEILQTFQRLDSTSSPRTKPSGITRPRRLVTSLWKWLSSRPEFVDNRGMYSDGWTWHPLTFAVFRKHVAEGRVLLTLWKNNPSSCCIYLDEGRRLTLGFVAGKPADVGKTVRMLRFMLSWKRHDKVRVLLPLRSPLIRALRGAGFEKTGKILVYEKFLG